MEKQEKTIGKRLGKRLAHKHDPHALSTQLHSAVERVGECLEVEHWK